MLASYEMTECWQVGVPEVVVVVAAAEEGSLGQNVAAVRTVVAVEVVAV